MTHDEARMRVIRAMRDPRFAARFTVRDKFGGAPFFIALASDLVSTVIERVVERGGRSNVVVAVEHGFRLLGVAEGPDTQRDVGDAQLVHIDTTMDMLLVALEQLCEDGRLWVELCGVEAVFPRGGKLEVPA